MFTKRFLTRFTRLGLATYIFTLCMSFTVCAQEHPLADMAVEGVMETAYDADDAAEEVTDAFGVDDTNVPRNNSTNFSWNNSTNGTGVSNDNGTGGNGENQPVPDDPTVNNETRSPVESLSLFWYDGNGNRVNVTDGLIPSPISSREVLRLVISSNNDVENFNHSKLSCKVNAESFEAINNETNVTADFASSGNGVELTLDPSNMKKPGRHTLQAVVKYKNSEKSYSKEASVCFVVDVESGHEFTISPVNITLYGPDNVIQPISVSRNGASVSCNDVGLRLRMREHGNAAVNGSLYGVYVKREETEDFILNAARATRSGRFELLAEYYDPEDDSDPVMYTKARVVVYRPMVLRMNVSSSVGNMTGTPSSPIRVENLDSEAQFKLNLGADDGAYDGSLMNEFDQSRVTWQVYEEVSGNSIPIDPAEKGIVFDTSNKEAAPYISFANITESGTFTFNATYNNTFTAADGNPRELNASTVTCRVSVTKEEPEDTLRAHLPKQSLKVDLYRVNNTLPLSIRSDDSSVSMGSYRVTGVRFADESKTSPLEIGLLDGGRTVNVNASRSFIDNAGSYFDEFRSSTVKTPLVVTLELDGKTKEYTTENITMTFAATKPVIKAPQALVFNSYQAGLEGKSIKFTGAEVGRIAAADTSSLPMWLRVNNATNTVDSTMDLPATVKKGTFKVAAFVEDARYNLPSGFNVTVPVTYSVQNKAPGVVLKTGKLTLNAVVNDGVLINYTIRNAAAGTNMTYSILDSRNRPISGGQMPLMVRMDDHDPDRGHVLVAVNGSNTDHGATYKLMITPINPENSRTGTAAVFTVKVLPKGTAGRYGITVSGKGDLDLSRPGIPAVRKVKGKNLRLDLYEMVSFNAVAGGKDITNSLNCDFNNATGKIEIFEKDFGRFALLKGGYAGKRMTLNVTFMNTVTCRNISKTFTVGLSEKKVQPKAGVKTLTVNPLYDGEAQMVIPLTNLPAGIYDYDVKINIRPSATRPATGFNSTGPAPFDYSIEHRPFNGTMCAAIVVTANPSALSSYAGSKGSISIKPVLPTGINATLKAGTVSVKLAVLNPASKKSAVSMTGKVKGSIDAIRDDSCATVTLSMKNVYDSFTALENSTLSSASVYKGSGRRAVDYTDSFRVNYDAGKLDIERANGKNLTAGTYKLALNITCPAHNDKVYRTTVSFKVVRGKKTGSALSDRIVTLVNRDYSYGCPIRISVGDTGVNDIANVTIGGSYANKYRIVKVSEGVYELGFVPGYVEKSGRDPIKKQVTKKNIPVKVFYKGSSVADTLKLKVITLP